MNCNELGLDDPFLDPMSLIVELDYVPTEFFNKLGIIHINTPKDTDVFPKLVQLPDPPRRSLRIQKKKEKKRN